MAIAPVVLYHINQFYGFNGPLSNSARTDPLFHLLNLGNFGVRLFFVISGFILSLPFAEHYLRGAKQVSLKQYFIRRLTRLEPPYIISLLIYFGVRWLAQGSLHASSISDLFLSLFYSTFAFHKLSTINYVTWSLEIEVQFYIFAPLLCTLFAVKSKIFRRFILAGTVLILGAFKTFVFNQPLWCLLDFLHYFVVGLLLCDLYLVSWEKTSRRPLVWDVVGLCSWALLVADLVCDFWVPMITPVLIFTAYCSAMRGRLWNKLLTIPLLVTIGGMCYTIYLYHVLLLAAPATATFACIRVGSAYWLNVIVQCIILCPLVFACSAILFAALERPFMVPNWPQLFCQQITAKTLLWRRKKDVIS